MWRLMRTAALLALIALVGCDTYDQDRARIDTGIASLVGQPQSAAIARFGVPSQSFQAAGETVIVWRRENVYFGTDDAPLACEIRISVNSAGIITRGEHQGNNLACSQMSRQMR
jgi:hypothetical protein